MTTWTITFVLVTALVFFFWVFLMFRLKPSRQYHDETRWEANIREGGFKVLWYFLLIAFFASIGAARIILWFMFLEK
jgi:hypothetical protein